MIDRLVSTATGSIAVRSAEASDQGYVASTWIHNMSEDGRLVDRVFDRLATRIVIAHARGDRGHIVGWCCYERQPRVTLLHMVYVRRKLRRMGIGTALQEQAVDGRRLPIVITAKQVPAWALKGTNMTRMTLEELLTP